MAAPRFTPEELRQHRTLAAEWAKIVSRRAFGDDESGLDVDIRTFEQSANAAHGLTEGSLQRFLQQQANKLPEHQLCPRCNRNCPTQTHIRSCSGETIYP